MQTIRNLIIKLLFKSKPCNTDMPVEFENDVYELLENIIENNTTGLQHYFFMMDEEELGENILCE